MTVSSEKNDLFLLCNSSTVVKYTCIILLSIDLLNKTNYLLIYTHTKAHMKKKRQYKLSSADNT